MEQWDINQYPYGMPASQVVALPAVPQSWSLKVLFKAVHSLDYGVTMRPLPGGYVAI